MSETKKYTHKHNEEKYVDSNETPRVYTNKSYHEEAEVVEKHHKPKVVHHRKEEKKDSGLLWTTILVGLTGAALVGALSWALAESNKKLDNMSAKMDQLATKVNTAPTAAAPAAPAKPEIKYGNTTIGESAVKGNKDTAKVAIVEYSDYECPFCKRHVTNTMPQILKEYVDTGKAIYVYRNNPLSFHEPNATQQAMAAECAGEQGKYWDMHDLIFQTTNSNKSNLNEDLLKTLPAKISGLDQAKWTSCYTSNKFADKIKADMAAANQAGLSGTPGFVVGKLDKNTGKVDGVLISGAYPFSAPAGSNVEIDFKTAIEKYLK